MPRGIGPWARGRAASEIRTGQWIKQYLEGEGEACIADMHRQLRLKIDDMNVDRKDLGKTLYRPPTYENFGKYVRNLAALGLMEFSGREEPLLEPPPGVELLTIKKYDDTLEVRPAVRRYYQLTAFGRAEPLEGRWGNPIKYLMER